MAKRISGVLGANTKDFRKMHWGQRRMGSLDRRLFPSFTMRCSQSVPLAPRKSNKETDRKLCELVSGIMWNVPNRTVLRLVLSHHNGMRRADLTPKQLSSVPCPTCGVAARARCLLHSGTPRSEPHVDRKLVAAEAVEKKRKTRHGL